MKNLALLLVLAIGGAACSAATSPSTTAPPSSTTAPSSTAPTGNDSSEIETPTPVESLIATIVHEFPSRWSPTEPLVVSPDGRFVFGIASDADAVCAFSLVEASQDICHAWTGNLAGYPEWSPDGRYLAFTEDWGSMLVDSDVWVMDTETGQLSNITEDGSTIGWRDGGTETPIDQMPFWDQTSERLYFNRIEPIDGTTRFMLMETTLDGPASVIHDFGSKPFPAIFQPGRWISSTEVAFTLNMPFEDYGPGIWALDVSTGGLRLLVGRDSELSFVAASTVSNAFDYAAIQFTGVPYDWALTHVVELLDLRTGSIYPILDTEDDYEANRSHTFGFSPDGKQGIVLWEDPTIEGPLQRGSPTLSVMNIVDGPSVASSLHTILTDDGAIDGIAVPLLGPTEGYAKGHFSTIVWTEDDRVIFGGPDKLIVAQLRTTTE